MQDSTGCPYTTRTWPTLHNCALAIQGRSASLLTVMARWSTSADQLPIGFSPPPLMDHRSLPRCDMSGSGWISIRALSVSEGLRAPAFAAGPRQRVASLGALIGASPTLEFSRLAGTWASSAKWRCGIKYLS